MVLHAATSPVPWSAALVRWHGLPPPPALVRLRQGTRESRQPRRAVWVSAVAQAAGPGSGSSRDSMDEQHPGASTSLPTAAERELNRTQRLRGWRVSTYEQRWRDRLWELKEFVADHGRLPRESEGRLGKWVKHQRDAYAAWQQGRQGTMKMTEERFAALEAVPCWSWDPREDQWQERYQQLLAFVEQHGRLPQQSKGELSNWVNTQRTAYAAWQQGKPCAYKMTDERIAVLEAVPGWTWDPWEDQWQERYQQLLAFVEQHGRLPKSREGELGSWVHSQRRAYAARQQGKPCTVKMTEERFAALEAVPGWTWDFWEDQWQERYQQLLAFVEQHGRLPQQSKGELGNWVNTQRKAHAAWQQGKPCAYKMTDERIAALEAVPGWSWAVSYEDQWQEMYQQLSAFVEQHGRLPKSREGELGTWVHRRRTAHRAFLQGAKDARRVRSMTAERAAALAAVPGWTEAL